MKDFTRVIKRLGILAALQVAAVGLPAVILRDQSTAVAIVQLLGVLFVTWLAYGAGYRFGHRGTDGRSSKHSG